MTQPQLESLAVTYIGDGVYAEIEYNSIRLYTQEGNSIFLEPAEWRKLCIWLKAKAPGLKWD